MGFAVLAAASLAASVGLSVVLSVRGVLVLVAAWTATVTLGVLSGPRYLIGVSVGVLTCLGAGTQARLTGYHLSAAVTPLTALVVGCLLGLLLARGLLASTVSPRAIGAVLVGVGLLLRWSSMVAGSPASGAVTLAGRSLHLGELVRVLVALGLAGLLQGNEAITGALWRGKATKGDVARWYSAAGLATGFIVLSLLVLHDTGPAVIIAVASAAMLYRAVGARLASIPIFVATACGAVVGSGSSELAQRWQDMSDPFGHGAAQLGRAMRAMGLTGLIGRGGGSSAMAETIPARTSDYLPSVVGADMGLVVLLAVLGTLFLVCLTLVIAARTVTGMGGILATGMAMLLLVPAVWTGLGNLGLLPLSGVDVPFLTANGTSTLASSITLGAALGALRWGESASVIQAIKSPSGHLMIVVSAVLAVALVAASGKTVHLAWTGGARLPAETLFRARGELLTADGHTIAQASSANGPRVYDPRYLSLGWIAPRSQQSGMEQVGAGALTCGHHLGRLGLWMRLGLANACAPRDTVTTLSHALQTRFTRETVEIPGTSMIALDAATGSVLAAASSSAQPSTAGSVAGLVGTMDLTRKLADGQNLPPELSMPIFTKAITAGSVFKLVTGTAAAVAGLQSPPLTGTYVPASGATVQNSWKGPCPDTSLRSMIAYSCNTTAAWYAVVLGRDRLAAAAQAFGFPRLTMTGPADPTAGNSPVTWRAGVSNLGAPKDAPALARTGFGQEGVRMTPYQVAYTSAVVASRGQVGDTTLIAGTCSGRKFQPWRSPTGNSLATRAAGMGTTPKVLQAALDEVYKGMQGAVTQGTAQVLDGVMPGHSLAAKTGTADVQDGIVSWVTVIVDRRLILTVAVEPTPNRARPANGQRPLAVAARILPILKPTSPSCEQK